MNNCTHDLFEVKNGQVDEGKGKEWSYYTVVVCAYCGHTRQLWSNGQVDIILEKGVVRRG